MTKHVHMIGVSGTGMGALATLFREAGARVTGSDVRFDPPIGPALASAGVECLEGWDPAHIGQPDLVVVGNAIRRDNAEAVAAEARGLVRVSMSAALREHFLSGRRAVVACGTHGKTTTSSMLAHVLTTAKLEPGFFIGGIPANQASSGAIGSTKRRLDAKGPSPFIVEGDEYDAVYWHKRPKFLDYVGVSPSDVVVLTSVEHDHIDIYPTSEAYESAFVDLVRAIPEGGLLFVDASQARAVAIAKEARCRVVTYGLADDEAEWSAALGVSDESGQAFDAYIGGSYCGRFTMQSPGAHNVRNALAAIAVAAEAFAIDFGTSRASFASFAGTKRRQELLGTPSGVRVYDDFAHHPTAVDVTLAALRAKHPHGSLFAVFEPRSATACRNLHQTAYAGAFGSADRVFFAPLGRTNIAPEERLDLAVLAAALGPKAEAPKSAGVILDRLIAEAKSGDTIAVLSNGAFGGFHKQLIDALERRVNG